MPQLWPNKPQSVQNPQSWADKLLASRMPTNPVSPPGTLTASTQNTLNSSENEDEDLNFKVFDEPAAPQASSSAHPTSALSTPNIPHAAQSPAYTSFVLANPPAAALYWGSLLPFPPEPRSPMLSRLIISLYEFLHQTSLVRVPQQSEKSAKAYLMPEQMVALFDLLDVSNIPCSESSASEYSVHTFDLALTFFCNKLKLSVALGTRDTEAEVVPNNMPLLSRKKFVEYIELLMRADPDGMCKRLSTLLSTPGKCFRDPFTDEPFYYREIPRECFPATGDAQALAFYTSAVEALVKEMPSLISRAQGLKWQAEATHQLPQFGINATELQDNPEALRQYWEMSREQDRQFDMQAKAQNDAHIAMMAGLQYGKSYIR